MKDMSKWNSLFKEDLSGLPIQVRRAEAFMYTDYEDVGYGGAINLEDMSARRDGQISDQGIWSWKDRARSTTYR